MAPRARLSLVSCPIALYPASSLSERSASQVVGFLFGPGIMHQCPFPRSGRAPAAPSRQSAQHLPKARQAHASWVFRVIVCGHRRRVSQCGAPAADKLEITLSLLIERADMIFRQAMAAGQFNAAINALKELGVLTGKR
jgi:hypothetical protein